MATAKPLSKTIGRHPCPEPLAAQGKGIQRNDAAAKPLLPCYGFKLMSRFAALPALDAFPSALTRSVQG